MWKLKWCDVVVCSLHKIEQKDLVQTLLKRKTVIMGAQVLIVTQCEL